MATMKPAMFLGESDPRRRAELEFFKACRSSLANDWMVVHSLRYVGSRPSLGQQRGNGEADFVLIHKSHGVIVVEVKGGSIDLRDGEWLSTDARGNQHSISNPFVQAEEAAQFFHDSLRRILGDIKAKGVVRHCVAFPSVSKRHSGKISTYGPAEMIIYREDLAQMNVKIEQLTQFWNQSTRWNDGDFTKVKQLFCPTVKTPGTSYLEYLGILEQLDELTESQKRTVRQLTVSTGKSVIVGGAGTGKTLLGMYRAQQLAADGKQVLFVCANPALARFLRSEVETNNPDLVGNLKIDTATNFISETARAGVYGKEFEDRKARFPHRQDRFLDAISNETPPIVFDCIILDEAQDISKQDLELLECLLRPASDGGAIFVFGDPNQQLALRRRECALDTENGGLELELDVNCRNTYEIAKIAHTFTLQSVDTLETRSGIQIRNRESSGNLKELVATEVAKIRNEFDPHSLAVLTLNGISDISDEDDLFVDGSRQELRTRRSTQDDSGHIPVFSIRAFQGRESDAVIVALSEKSLLRTYPFEQFFSDAERVRPPAPQQNGAIDDLRRVQTQYQRFVQRVNQEAVPAYRKMLEQSGDFQSERKMEFLVREFERCRRREFSPNFRNPWLAEYWGRQQTNSLRVVLYSMMTRARVILSIVSDTNVKTFIDYKATTLGDETTGLLEDVAD